MHVRVQIMCNCDDYWVALHFAMLALAKAPSVDLGYMDTLPRPDAPSMQDVGWMTTVYASARLMIAEVLEQQGRFATAVDWAQTELEVLFATCARSQLASQGPPTCLRTCL